MVVINFEASAKVSSMPNALLLVEHTVVLMICHYIIKKHFVKQKLQNRFFLFFIIGYCISLFYMYYEWKPQLIKTFSTDWDAFDPIKYYSMATVSIQSGHLLDGMEWFPVSYVIYAILRIFGLHPLVPLFFNEVVFVYSICTLTNFLNEDRPFQIKYYSWLLLIPEALCFVATSSKDVLCMLCATIVFVKASELLQKKISLSKISIAALFYLIFIMSRTSLAMASVCGIMLTVVFAKKMTKQTIFLSAAIVTIMFAAFTLTDDLGSNADSISKKVKTELSGDVSNSAELMGQSANSFAKKIIPHNTVEYIVFGFVRSICYIVINPRFVKSPISTMVPLDGLTMLWLTDITTLLMCISFFYILLWLKKSFKHENRNVKSLFIVTFLYWYSVGTFNPLMIHVRYRVVYDILFFAIAIRTYLAYKHKVKVHQINTIKRQFYSK